MLKVGLTGSIAVGKSHVLAIFSELGCKTLDADRTAREVVGAGSKGLNLIETLPDEAERAQWELALQAQLGPALIAAPVLEAGARTREVYLPEGRWIDWSADDCYRGPRRLRIDPI